jgi:predicted dehydrogenase
MKLILVGVSGFSERWINVFFSSRKAKPEALVDINRKALDTVCRKFNYPGKKCFTSLKTALKKSAAQGVVVTVPTKFHYAYTREALAAGKHVLVEKPLTLTLSQSKKLAALARSKRKVLSVVSQHRFAPYLQVIKRYCRNGRGNGLGKPLSFFTRIQFNRPESYYDLEARRTGHGVLAIQGVHCMDWIHWLFGESKSCTAAIGTLFHRTKNEDNAYAMVKMKSGIMGLFDINHMTRGQNRFEFDVYFSKGVLRFNNFSTITIEKGDKVKQVKFRKVNPQFDSLKDQLENFIGACQHKKRLEVTAKDGLRVMKLLESLYKSSRHLASVK